MDLSLVGKRAVVCGSTQGIGLAVAKELALLGASCVLLARNETELQQVVKGLATTDGQQHDYAIADFKETEAVRRAIHAIVDKAPVHILVNNTGGPPAGPIVDATEEQFIQAFNQHVINNHILTKAVLPGMKSAAYGRIINIVSTSVKIPLPNLGVSNTIRGAVASWAKTMANELGQYGITVNNMLPGFTETQRLTSIIAHAAQKDDRSEDEVAKDMAATIPAGRFGAAEELGAVAAFLASPAASYINGVSLPVDGGRTGAI